MATARELRAEFVAKVTGVPADRLVAMSATALATEVQVALNHGATSPLSLVTALSSDDQVRYLYTRTLWRLVGDSPLLKDGLVDPPCQRRARGFIAVVFQAALHNNLISLEELQEMTFVAGSISVAEGWARLAAGQIAERARLTAPRRAIPPRLRRGSHPIVTADLTLDGDEPPQLGEGSSDALPVELELEAEPAADDESPLDLRALFRGASQLVVEPADGSEPAIPISELLARPGRVRARGSEWESGASSDISLEPVIRAAPPVRRAPTVPPPLPADARRPAIARELGRDKEVERLLDDLGSDVDLFRVYRLLK